MRGKPRFAVVLFATAITAFISIANAEAQRPIVAVKAERLSGLVRDRSLSLSLEQVSRESRMAIARAAGVGNQRVWPRLRDVPLVDTLREIRPDCDAFFFYGVDREGPASLKLVCSPNPMP